MKKVKVWDISLSESANVIFQIDIPLGCITERKVEELLRCLVAKKGLSFNEISDSFCKKNSKKYATHLELNVVRRKNNYSILCGNSIYAIATIKDVVK